MTEPAFPTTWGNHSVQTVCRFVRQRPEMAFRAHRWQPVVCRNTAECWRGCDESGHRRDLVTRQKENIRRTRPQRSHLVASAFSGFDNVDTWWRTLIKPRCIYVCYTIIICRLMISTFSGTHVNVPLYVVNNPCIACRDRRRPTAHMRIRCP